MASLRHILGHAPSALIWSCALMAGLPMSAHATKPVDTGFADYAFLQGAREQALDGSVAARSSYARINVIWRHVATAQPASPGNPADPAYDFSAIDAAVSGAGARGQDFF